MREGLADSEGLRMALGKDLVLVGGLVAAMGLAFVVANSGAPDDPLQGLQRPSQPQKQPSSEEVLPPRTTLPEILPEQVGMVDSEYQADVAAMLNLLRDEVPECRESINPMNAGADSAQPEPGNPHFFVFCGTDQRKKVLFTWMDAVNNNLPTQKATIVQSNAASACENAARSQALDADSVRLSRIMDSAFQDHGDGLSTYSSTFKVKNGFGVELQYNIRCRFDGDRLTDADVWESS